MDCSYTFFFHFPPSQATPHAGKGFDIEPVQSKSVSIMPADYHQYHHHNSPSSSSSHVVVENEKEEEEERVMTVVVDDFINHNDSSNKEGGKWGPTLVVCSFFIYIKFLFELLFLVDRFDLGKARIFT